MQYQATIKYPGYSPFTYQFTRDHDHDAKDEIKKTIGKGVFVKLERKNEKGEYVVVH